MALLQLILHITNFKSPLARIIVPSVGAAIALQAASGLPSILAQTERFYDISGSLTVLAVGALSLYIPALRSRAGDAALPSLLSAFKAGGNSAAWNWRQIALTGMSMAWTIRLGSYLFARISNDGTDSRFDRIRTKPARFSVAFFLQAMWVSLLLIPVMAINAVPAAAFATLPRLVVTDVVGIGAWAFGMTYESLADAQKSRWMSEKKNKVHDEEFLAKGLFSRSRFPHYFGEITLWTGLATAAAGTLAMKPVQVALGFSGGPAGILATTVLSFIAPAFSSFLLLKVSGVPLTEKRHDHRFKNNKKYQEWKESTPRLIPKLG